MSKLIIFDGGFSDGEKCSVPDDWTHITMRAEPEQEVLCDASAMPTNQSYLIETYRIDNYPDIDGRFIARLI
ncbi:MAG TPA: hypothetical protein VFD12_00045 [Oligella sp.]|nr:hypothetical protein [Oligella sp.]